MSSTTNDSDNTEKLQLEASKSEADYKAPSSLKEPPPSYGCITASPASPSAGPSSGFAASQAGNCIVGNFISHTRRAAIKGSYTINPAIDVPAGLLSPHDTTKDAPKFRQNLVLKAIQAKLDVDITLVGDVGMAVPPVDNADPERTRLWVHSEYKSLTARLRTSSTGPPRNFRVVASCDFGNINLDIPHTFHGLVSLNTMKSSASISFSDPLQARLSVLSDDVKNQRYFIGDIGSWKGNEWSGDEIAIVINYGKVKLRIVDEKKYLASMAKGDGKSKKRLFGW